MVKVLTKISGEITLLKRAGVSPLSSINSLGKVILSIRELFSAVMVISNLERRTSKEHLPITNISSKSPNNSLYQ